MLKVIALKLNDRFSIHWLNGFIICIVISWTQRHPSSSWPSIVYIILCEQLPIHRHLQREAISDFELIPADDSRSVKLAVVELELAVFEIKQWGQRSYDLRQQPSLSPRQQALVGGLVTTINESVRIFVVSM